MDIIQILLYFLLLHTALGTTESPSPCDTLNLRSSYDNIVVGSGPGGSVAARRLAEFNPRETILQIERGIKWEDCELCQTPATVNLAGDVANPANNLFTTVPQPHVDNKVFNFSDPSIQGGATSVNGMLWVRTNAHEYFDSYWPSGWSWDVMRPYYELVENYTYLPGFYNYPFNHRINYRGDRGLIKPTQTSNEGLIAQFLNATKTIYPNMPVYHHNSINNGNYPGYGSSPPELQEYNYTRSSAFPSYIETYKGDNLLSINGVRVNKVLFSGKKAIGVEIVAYNQQVGIPTTSQVTCNVYSNTIVVSAGTIGTPKLLKLSGVGPKYELFAHNIAVISDNKGVGANLDDQIVVPVATLPLFPSPPNPIPIYGTAYWNAEDIPGHTLNINTGYSQITAPGLEVGVFITQKLFARSRGNVRISSADPNDQPLVDPNYLASPLDRHELALGLNKTLQLAKALGAVLVLNPCANSTNCSSPADTLDAYLKAGLPSVGYHFTSTSTIGDVVSEHDMSVKGTKGLYVLDASVLPKSPGGNPSFTIYAVAERGIELIQHAKRAHN